MNRRRPADRKGTTTVEFAFVAPLVFVFFFGSYEFSRMAMIRQTVEMAAYEGARRGVVPGATVDDVVARCNQVLLGVGTRNAQITVTPNPITAQTSQITVDVQAPLDDNAWIAPAYLKGKKFDRAFTLSRENVSWGMTSQPPPAPPAQAAAPPPTTANDNHNSGNNSNGQNSWENNNKSGNSNNNGWNNNGNGNNGNGNGNNGNGNGNNGNGNGNNGNGNGNNNNGNN